MSDQEESYVRKAALESQAKGQQGLGVLQQSSHTFCQMA